MGKSLKSYSKRIMIPPEMRLLMLCADFNLSEEKQQEILTRLDDKINWDTFYHMTIKNRLSPLVYKNLKKLGTDHVDKNILLKFETDYRFIQYHSLLLTHELLYLIKLLKEHHINVLSIKGPALAMSLYQDISMRVSRDLDLLASPSDIGLIHNLLLEAGYVKDSEIRRLTPRQEKLYSKTYPHYTYTSNKGITLELHWVLSNDYYNIPFERLFQNQKEIVISGEKLPVLSDEENLVYLIFHGSKHAWERLEWLCDVCHMIKYKSLDWNHIMKRSRQLGILPMLGQTFLLLKTFFHYRPGIRLPLTPKDKMFAKRLAILSLPFMLSVNRKTDINDHPLFGDHRKYRLYWNLGLDKKLLFFIFPFLPKPEDFNALRIPDRYFFLYYIFHLFRMIKQCLTFHKKDLPKKKLNRSSIPNDLTIKKEDFDE